MKSIFLNSGMSFITQITTIILQFAVRNLFLSAFGVEILGLNSTFTSILGALSLAELGFNTAIVYSLYKPIHDQNEKEINDILNIYKWIYRCIGVFFVVGTFVCMPFLRYIIKGINVTTEVYSFFALQAMSSACTYFMAYRRTLLYVDQKEYVCKIVDLLCNVLCSVFQIISMIFLKNYIVYLCLMVIKVYSSNFYIHCWVKKRYAYLHNAPINRTKLGEILANIKDVFTGKLANYIYNSTDSLVISSFISTAIVGYLSNYTMITNNLKIMMKSVLNPITPIIGNRLIERSECPEDNESDFMLFTYVRYLIAIFCLVPMLCLIDDFVEGFFGSKYVLTRTISILLTIDLYIDIVHSNCCQYIESAGLFKLNKFIDIIGAMLNIILSIFLAKIIGLPGVLIGTVVGQVFFWLTRSYLVYSKCFKVQKARYYQYWKKISKYTMLFVSIVFVGKVITSWLVISNWIISFIVKGVLLEAVSAIALLICTCRTSEFTNLKAILLKVYRSRIEEAINE